MKGIYESVLLGLVLSNSISTAIASRTDCDVYDPVNDQLSVVRKTIVGSEHVPEAASCVRISHDRDVSTAVALDANAINSGALQEYRVFYFDPGIYHLQGKIDLGSFYPSLSPYVFSGIDDKRRPIIHGDSGQKRIFSDGAFPGGAKRHKYYVFENLDLRMSCDVNSEVSSCGILDLSPFRTKVINTSFKSQFGYCIKHNSEHNNNDQVAYESYFEGNFFRCRYSFLTHYSEPSTVHNKPTDNFFLKNKFEVIGTQSHKGFAFVGFDTQSGIRGPGMVGTLVKDNIFLLYHNTHITRSENDQYTAFTGNHIKLNSSYMEDLPPHGFKSLTQQELENEYQDLILIGPAGLSGAMTFNNNYLESRLDIKASIFMNFGDVSPDEKLPFALLSHENSGLPLMCRTSNKPNLKICPEQLTNKERSAK